MRGRGSGKRLVSLFLGCALIVVGLIGPQVVGRADGNQITGTFTPSTVTQGAIHSIAFSGQVLYATPASIESIAARALKNSNGNVITAPALISYVSSSGVVSFNVATGVDTPAGTYEVSGKALTATLSDKTTVDLSISASFSVENKSSATPAISDLTVSPSSIIRGAGAKVTYSGTVSNLPVTSYSGITAKYASGSNIITNTIGKIENGKKFTTDISIPSTVTEGAYKLTTIEGITGLVIPTDAPSFTVRAESPAAPTITASFASATVKQGSTATLNIEVSDTDIVTIGAITLSKGADQIVIPKFSITDGKGNTTVTIPDNKATGDYTVSSGAEVECEKSGSSSVKCKLSKGITLVVDDKDAPATPTLSAVFNPAKVKQGGTSTFNSTLTNGDDIQTIGAIKLTLVGDSSKTIDIKKFVANSTPTITVNEDAPLGIYKLPSGSKINCEKEVGSSVEVSTISDITLEVISKDAPTSPTLTNINLTSEVLPNGIVYFSGKVSPKPTGDTISASFVPEAIGGTEIPFSTGISSDGTFSGQIPVGNVAVGSIYKLTGVKVGTTNITWDGQYMFRVVNSVSTPTLSTLAIGTPYTTSGTTTIPLSATIASAGTTGGVANTIKYIEIDYAIDTTTPAKATLYTTSNTSTLFTGSVARQFTNGSSHTITLSRARIYYQAGSDTSGNKVKEYDSLTGLITNNPLRFTVSNYTPSPVNPVNPVDPSNPSTPTNNTAVNQRAANTIIAMANNGSATLDYTSSPTVSANIFDLLRGTQKTVNLLAPGGFIWTFNGATVTGASKQIDLRVTATTLAATGATNSFPLVASLTGNRPVVILNFANNGVLPGTATITIPVSQHTSYIGTSNIYQYFVNESTRRLEKVGGPVTVSSGNTVTMAINHNSTYILTYGEVAGATASTTPTNNASDVLPIYNANATPTVTTPTNTTPTAGTTVNTVYRPGSTSPKTGDAFRMYVWVGMLLIGAFLVFASVLWPKKKEKSA